MRAWEQRVPVFAPAWEWAPLERVWCQVSASVFPARRSFPAQWSFQVRRWFPEQPWLFRARQSRQAFERSLGLVRRARVFFPEQESAPLGPVFAPAWESVPLVPVFVGALE